MKIEYCVDEYGMVYVVGMEDIFQGLDDLLNYADSEGWEIDEMTEVEAPDEELPDYVLDYGGEM